MKKLICASFTLYVLLIFSSSLLQADNVVRLATLEWPPYIGEKLPDQGYVAKLVRESYKAVGYTVELTYMPWARVVAMARHGDFDGYVPEYFTDALTADFFFSKPFPGGPLGFFKRKADTIRFKTLSDLKSYKIGVVRNYVNTVNFDNADFLHKEAAVDDLTNLRKLLGRRLDLVVADKFVGFHVLKQDMPERAQEIEFVLPALEEKNLYLCISKKVPEAMQKIAAFNAGLQAITENGTFALIMKDSLL